jgi:hypothetical protein
MVDGMVQFDSPNLQTVHHGLHCSVQGTFTSGPGNYRQELQAGTASSSNCGGDNYSALIVYIRCSCQAKLQVIKDG